jgi:hypothetical protein
LNTTIFVRFQKYYSVVTERVKFGRKEDRRQETGGGGSPQKGARDAKGKRKDERDERDV